jgi:hypothetical protein
MTHRKTTPASSRVRPDGGVIGREDRRHVAAILEKASKPSDPPRRSTIAAALGTDKLEKPAKR